MPLVPRSLARSLALPLNRSGKSIFAGGKKTRARRRRICSFHRSLLQLHSGSGAWQGAMFRERGEPSFSAPFPPPHLSSFLRNRECVDNQTCLLISFCTFHLINFSHNVTLFTCHLHHLPLKKEYHTKTTCILKRIHEYNFQRPHSWLSRHIPGALKYDMLQGPSY